MKHTSQTNAISNNGHNGASSAYWKSVRRCTVRRDGITEIVHATGLVESFDIGGRPIGLHRLRGAPARSAADNNSNRGDLKMMPCRKVGGPSVIHADGMWKITHRDGITERFAETRRLETPDTPCHATADASHALAA